MEIIIYKTTGCGYCAKVVQLMERANVDYKSILVGEDLTREEFKEKHPEAHGFPHVVIDGIPVGGLTDTVKLFVERGLVSSKKK